MYFMYLLDTNFKNISVVHYRNMLKTIASANSKQRENWIWNNLHIIFMKRREEWGLSLFFKFKFFCAILPLYTTVRYFLVSDDQQIMKETVGSQCQRKLNFKNPAEVQPYKKVEIKVWLSLTRLESFIW